MIDLTDKEWLRKGWRMRWISRRFLNPVTYLWRLLHDH